MVPHLPPHLILVELLISRKLEIVLPLPPEKIQLPTVWTWKSSIR